MNEENLILVNLLLVIHVFMYFISNVMIIFKIEFTVKKKKNNFTNDSYTEIAIYSYK